MSNSVWAGILHAVAQLRDEDFDWLLGLPSFLKLPGVIIGHAAMHDIESWPYLVDDADILATLDELAARKFTIGFFGHSHDQEWFTKSPKGTMKRSDKAKSMLPADRASAVVVGSVGQPRTRDPRAAWTLWQPQARSIEFRRTAYPVEQTMAAIKACGLPLKSAQRLARGVWRHSPDAPLATSGPATARQPYRFFRMLPGSGLLCMTHSHHPGDELGVLGNANLESRTAGYFPRRGTLSL